MEQKDKDPQVHMALMAQNIKYIVKEVESIKKELKFIKDMLIDKYITKEELDLRLNRYELPRRIVYGLVTLILIGFAGAIIALVLK